MIIEKRIATGKAACKGHYIKITKGEQCYYMSKSQFGYPAYFCENCLLDLFSDFETGIKNVGLYNKFQMKAILK